MPLFIGLFYQQILTLICLSGGSLRLVCLSIQETLFDENDADNKIFVANK